MARNTIDFKFPKLPPLRIEGNELLQAQIHMALKTYAMTYTVLEMLIEDQIAYINASGGDVERVDEILRRLDERLEYHYRNADTALFAQFGK